MKNIIFNTVCILAVGFFIFIAIHIPQNTGGLVVIGAISLVIMLAMIINNEINAKDNSLTILDRIRRVLSYGYFNGQAIIGIIVLFLLFIAVLILLEEGINLIF